MIASTRFARATRASAVLTASRCVVGSRLRWPRFLAVISLGVALLLSHGCGTENAVSELTDRGDVAARMMRGMGPTNVETPESNFRLIDIAATAGVDFSYHNGEEAGFAAIPELVGGGAAVIDFDQDGWLDLLLPGGGKLGFDDHRECLPPGLFRNLGDMKFRAVAGVAGDFERAGSRIMIQGVYAADFDNDGFPDVLLAGYGGAVLLSNQGDGTFAKAANSGLRETSWVTGAAWADVNGDGALDLYLARFVDWSHQNHPVCPGRSDEVREYCDPADFQPLPDSLLLSGGDGSFRDVTEAWGVRRDGRGLGVVAGDIDGDRDIDIAVANYAGANFLYRNEGGLGFTEIGELSGAGTTREGGVEHGAGMDLGDLDQDGYLDLWTTNCDREIAAFHRNVGPDLFYHASHAWGVAGVGAVFSGWGTALTDIDSDQDLDILVMAGHRQKFPRRLSRRQYPVLLENQDGERAVNVAPQMRGFFSQLQDARGVAVGDLDNDGDQDLIVSRINQPYGVLENRSLFSHHSVQLRLIGTRSARWPVGVRAVIETANRDQLLTLRSGGGLMSTHDPRLHVGLGTAASINRLQVTWPSGAVVEFRDFNAQGTLVLVEPPG